MEYQYWNSRLSDGKILEYVIDKKKSAQSYINYMLIRLQKMFKYDGLPDTIPKEIFESYLMENGSCYVTKVDGELYAFIGSFGGEPDPYYRPTLYVVANPALKLSKIYNLWEDGVLVRNDSLWLGLRPLMARYATLLTENIVTIRSAEIMLRVIALLTAPDDKTKEAGELYLKKIERGELGVIAENRFFEGIKMQSPPSNNGSYLTQFIELQQYLKASFFNEIGLNANYNMKREAIMEGESNLNKDSLLPLCDEMLSCRKEDISKINEMFGTNITVDYDSAWKQNVEEIAAQMENLNGSKIVNKGNSSNNGISTSSTNGGNELESDGSTSSSIRDDGGSSRTDDDGASDDVSRSGEGAEESLRDEIGDEKVTSESQVNVEVDVLVDYSDENKED